jgi:GNAT superfamily N-acetyltransferase
VLTISAEPLDSADARRLIGELDDHLSSLYPPEDNFTELPTADAFLIARIDGVAIGCGAVRFIDAITAEVKRMYVAPSARGGGVGREIVRALEVFAREQGAQRLVLETGPKQLEAIALYENLGFAVTPCWGQYINGKNSICYEKVLPSKGTWALFEQQ